MRRNRNDKSLALTTFVAGVVALCLGTSSLTRTTQEGNICPEGQVTNLEAWDYAAALPGHEFVWAYPKNDLTNDVALGPVKLHIETPYTDIRFPEHTMAGTVVKPYINAPYLSLKYGVGEFSITVGDFLRSQYPYCFEGNEHGASGDRVITYTNPNYPSKERR